MLLWGMIFVGILLFGIGLYFMVKNYKKGRYIKGYGLMSYIGLGIVLLGVILIMEPLFTSLPGNLPNTLPWGISMIVFIISGNLLLKPTFLKQK